MTRHLKNQIVIIGAGPAGITTALFLAKNKIQSILLDKEQFPRHKTCGDNIAGNTLRILGELDPSWAEKMDKDKLAVPIKGMKVHAPNFHDFNIDFLPLEKDTTQDSCYGIKRIEFDNYLLKLAKNDPHITIIENCNIAKIERLKTGLVQIKNKAEDLIIDTQLVAFCTGSNSSIMNDLYPVTKTDKDIAVGVRAYFEGVMDSNPGYAELFIPKKFLPGGLYLTPMPNGLMNVNAVMRSDVVKKKKINLTELMMQELKEHPTLMNRFKNATLVDKPQGSTLFLGTKDRKLSGDNFIFVGDAAGLIDFLSANGIPQAMISAKIAAEEIKRCVLANDFSAVALAPYDEKVYKRLKNSLKMTRVFTPFWSNTVFLRVMTFTMNYIAKKFNKNNALNDLLYEKNMAKKLFNPVFHYKMFFGVKPTEALKS